jgi:hypothetical protein
MMMMRAVRTFSRGWRPREQQQPRPGYRTLLLFSTTRHGCCRKHFPAPLRRHNYLDGMIIVGAAAPFERGRPVLSGRGLLPALFAYTQSPKHAIIKASSCDSHRSIKVLYSRASRMTTRKWAAIWSYGKHDSPPVASCQRGGRSEESLIGSSEDLRLAESSSRCGWTRMKASSHSHKLVEQARQEPAHADR